MMAQVPLEEIEKVLNEKIRPELALHEGGIQIADYENGILRVRLLGQCNNCPSAVSTMENLVQEELLAIFPQLGGVELETGVSDSLIEQARQLLQQRHLP